MRKTLCHSHRIVHTFGLVSFHHTQAHTFGLNKLHSSALIISSHSFPTNKLHSSHHTFNSFTRYTVFLSLITSSHSSPTKKLHSSHLHFNSFKRYAVFLSLITSSHSYPTNELHSSHPFKSLTSYAVFLSTHHIVSFFSHEQAPQFIPSGHSRAGRSSSSSIITSSHSSSINDLRSSSVWVIHSLHSLPLQSSHRQISSHLSPTNKLHSSFLQVISNLHDLHSLPLQLLHCPSLQVIHKVSSHPSHCSHRFYHQKGCWYRNHFMYYQLAIWKIYFQHR